MIALVHAPSPDMQACERTFVPRVPIDFQAALRQHASYCRALRDCGCDVRVLDVNRDFPDGTFLEDTAVVLDEVAVLATMGAASRKAEPANIEPVLRQFRQIERIGAAASLEGGDVLRVGRTLLVGHSRRTSPAGIEGLSEVVSRFGYRVTAVSVRDCLHLKTACTALPDGRLLVNRAWIDSAALTGFPLLHLAETEPLAANVVLVGQTVLMAAGQPRTVEQIRREGFEVREVDISEFAKAEGGVTCLSLLIRQ